MDDQSFFINGSESWKVSSSFLELEDFTFVLSIEVLKDLIFALVLDGDVQVIQNEKISSSFFELEGVVFILAIDMLEDFILTLLLEATWGERKGNKA